MISAATVAFCATGPRARHGQGRRRPEARTSPATGKLALNIRKLVVGHAVQIDKASARGFDAAQELVEFERHDLGFSVLGVLDDEDHQESDDSGAGVDEKLPPVRVGKVRPRDCQTMTVTVASRSAQGLPTAWAERSANARKASFIADSPLSKHYFDVASATVSAARPSAASPTRQWRQ
jgi:hypothetical protein